MIVFCNQRFPDPAAENLLADSLTAASHRLIYASSITTSNLHPAAADTAIHEADVAFGQPDVDSLLDAPQLRWVQLTTAGYERYDRPDLRAALAARGGALTSSSGVYVEPCAEHVLAMLLAQARRLPRAHDNQRDDHAWPAAAIRRSTPLLRGQTVLLLSFGTIARRVVELLAPLGMTVLAVRRTPAGDEPVPVFTEDLLDDLLPRADHVINILPGGASTRAYVSAARLARMKPGAAFYNIGRGSTVDHDALLDALRANRLAAAWLDVTDPEPLPPEHPLWTAPHCHITPHTAGGQVQEFVRVVEHFLDNLARFERGQPLADRVI